MGLDVYVGTLTRYYAGEWKTVVQTTARDAGMTVHVVRQSEPPDAVRDPAQLEAAVIAWRSGISAGLVDHLERPLMWREGMAPPYFTDKPAWDCYSALLIWAAHDEHSDGSLPVVAPDDWTTDPAIALSQAAGFRSRYGQLLYDTELWLPGTFGFTFRAEDPTGSTVGIGSVEALAEQLRELNERTWRADAPTLRTWRQAGAECGGPFEVSARFGFAVLESLAQSAAEHCLPMKLDY
jgi:hypothetical protein